MTRRRVIIFSLAVLVTAVVIVYLCIPKEPRYQGRTLSQWVNDGETAFNVELRAKLPIGGYPTPPSANELLAGNPKWQAATNAVQHIGTNAIPWLIKWSFAKDSKLKVALAAWLQRHPAFHLQLSSNRALNDTGAFGLAMLGGQAESAWPLVVQRTFDKDVKVRETALNCLIDGEAPKELLLPVFQRLTSDPDQQFSEIVQLDFLQYLPADAREESSKPKSQQETKDPVSHTADANKPGPNHQPTAN
jgi:hypothetical protein